MQKKVAEVEPSKTAFLKKERILIRGPTLGQLNLDFVVDEFALVGQLNRVVDMATPFNSAAGFLNTTQRVPRVHKSSPAVPT